MSRKFTSIIPKAIREQLWLRSFGENYKAKCTVIWCRNQITVFNYEVGHNIPRSKGGCNGLENLSPICSRCNKSMTNKFSIDGWNQLLDSKKI